MAKGKKSAFEQVFVSSVEELATVPHADNAKRFSLTAKDGSILYTWCTQATGVREAWARKVAEVTVAGLDRAERKPADKVAQLKGRVAKAVVTMTQAEKDELLAMLTGQTPSPVEATTEAPSKGKKKK